MSRRRYHRHWSQAISACFASRGTSLIGVNANEPSQPTPKSGMGSCKRGCRQCRIACQGSEKRWGVLSKNGCQASQASGGDLPAVRVCKCGIFRLWFHASDVGSSSQWHFSRRVACGAGGRGARCGAASDVGASQPHIKQTRLWRRVSGAF